jgi:hypothetical protein
MGLINNKQFATTQTENMVHPVDAKTITEYICGTFKDWSQQRQPLEEDWKASWAEYFSNCRSADTIRQEAFKQIGDVQADWRSKIPTGKAFELVEDANSYLQGAFFPNKQWFDVYPQKVIPDPDWQELIRVIQKYIQVKLDKAYFQEWWDMNIRQCIITGTSVVSMPWRYDAIQTTKNVQVTDVRGKKKVVPRQVEKVIRNGLDITVVDMFDFFIDPFAVDTRDANCIRRYTKTKAELIRLAEDGVYNQTDNNTIRGIQNARRTNTESTAKKAEVTVLAGATKDGYDPQDKIEVIEYWGDICVNGLEYNDVCATVVDDTLIDFKPNPFWGGKPYVITTFVRTHDSPYGIGMLSPVLGQLHQLFVTLNHRLDIGELVVNPMWKVLQDGTLDLDSLFSAPGKILPVADIDNIVPVAFDVRNLGINVQEEQMLEQRLERVTGISAYVGQGMGRDAERVTAEEVKSKRDAGGNRLGRYHKHMEETALRELLEKTYSFIQQFVVEDEVVRVVGTVPGSVSGSFDFIKVGQDELQHDVDIIPVGSDWVIDKEREITERLDFITVVSQHPEMSQMINWEEVIKDLARRMVKQDWDKFVRLQPPAPPMPPEGMLPPGMPPGATPEEMMGATPQLEQPPVMSVPLEQRMAEQVPLEGKEAIMSLASDPQQLAQLLQ